MNNLKNLGVTLRTLEPNLSYDKLLQDLNYNFVQILQSPGFKGIPGESIQGPIGESTRGSRWVFIDIPKFQSVYHVIQTADQINLLFINAEFANDPDKLFSAFYIPNDTVMILGDTLVLPSGSIIELVEKNGTVVFVDTGVTFSQVAQLTKDDVLQMIIDYLASIADNEKSGFTQFKAEAKNANDTQPSLNTNYTQGSVVDIDVENSGPGYGLNNYKILAPDELSVTEATKLLVLAGSAKNYHKLIQGSQTDLTNAYAPQVNTLPAMVVLQNNYENGIIFGAASENNFRNFGRLYRTATSVILTSSFSPFSNEYSDITLSNSDFKIRAGATTISSNSLSYSGNIVKSNQLNAIDRIVKLGINPTLDTETEFSTHPQYYTRKLILSATEEIHLRSAGLSNATILSLVGTKFSATYSITNAINNSIYQVPTSAAIYNAFELTDIRLDNLEDDVEYLENHYFGQRTNITTNISLNSLFQFGSYNLVSGITIQDLPTIIANPSGVNIPTPATVLTKDSFLNVYRVKMSPTTYAITQELIYAYPYNYSEVDINEQRYVKFFRVGYLSATNVNGIAGTASWGVWSRIVDGYDKIYSKNSAIEIEGSFHANNLSVKHKDKESTLTDQVNSNTTKVIKSMTFDEQGHPKTVQSDDLADTFVQHTDYPFDEWELLLNKVAIFMSAFTNGGGMVLWNKPYNEIPAGWQEVVDWRKRLPMGYDPSDTTYDQVGKIGGKSEHVITIGQMPKHSHNFSKLKENVGKGNQNGLSATDGPQHNTTTSQAGNNEPIPLLNPFRIVVFIEMVH